MPAGPDRPSNPGPSRPANPGPNNPNYNLNPSWPPGEQWPRTPTSPDHHFEPHYGFDSNHQRKSFCGYSEFNVHNQSKIAEKTAPCKIISRT